MGKISRWIFSLELGIVGSLSPGRAITTLGAVDRAARR
jgi:hypothetical protein